jgi:hypothetical protein
MKQTLNPPFGCGRLARANTVPILLTSALGWLGADVPSACAQDETIPLAAQIREVQTVLPQTQIRTTLKYSLSPDKLLLFPAYGMDKAEFKQGGNCTAAVDAESR